MTKSKASHSSKDGTDHSNTDGSNSKKHDIVVVKEAHSNTELDPELQKIERIPMFVPIIKTMLNIPILNDSDYEQKLDNRPILQLCTR